MFLQEYQWKLLEELVWNTSTSVPKIYGKKYETGEVGKVILWAEK